MSTVFRFWEVVYSPSSPASSKSTMKRISCRLHILWSECSPWPVVQKSNTYFNSILVIFFLSNIPHSNHVPTSVHSYGLIGAYESLVSTIEYSLLEFWIGSLPHSIFTPLSINPQNKTSDRDRSELLS